MLLLLAAAAAGGGGGGDDDVLMQGKATIDVPSNDSGTAMMCALVNCKASLTELLIQHGQSSLSVSLSVCVSACLSVCHCCSCDRATL